MLLKCPECKNPIHFAGEDPNPGEYRCYNCGKDVILKLEKKWSLVKSLNKS